VFELVTKYSKYFQKV